MKVAILLCLVAVAFAQTRLPPRDPRENTLSECGTRLRMNCSSTTATCVERRLGDSVQNFCQEEKDEGQSCMGAMGMIRPIRDGDGRDSDGGDSDGGDRDGGDRDGDDRDPRDNTPGARARTVAENIGNIPQEMCRSTNCRNRTCQAPTMCQRMRASNRSEVTCDSEGLFTPAQCVRNRLGSYNCRCVRRNGTAMRIEKNGLTAMQRKEFTCPLKECRYMSNNRNLSARHGSTFQVRRNDSCYRCLCNEGERTCRPINCTRPRATNRPCMMNGKSVPHNGMRMLDRCNNTCTCRNGTLRCTRLRCDDDTDNERDETMRRQDRECADCETSSRCNEHVCAVRTGRTFRSRCHAMKCQNHKEGDLITGSCGNRDGCSQRTVPDDSFCLRSPVKTQMSRQSSPTLERIVPRNITCRSTETRDGKSRVVPLKNDVNTEDPDDLVVCGSDNNTYASLCNMIIESEGQPRAEHQGECRKQNDSRKVCGTDGVTYMDEDTMRTQGGNVRMDYKGACACKDNMNRCAVARDNDRCEKLDKCMRRVNTTDACCPSCGGAVLMAMDQDAVDEHVESGGDIRTLDDFASDMMRERQDKPSVIPRNATKRCNVSFTRPSSTRGNMTEVLFKAMDMEKDGEFCYMHAKKMRDRIMEVVMNETVEATTAQTLVSNALLAPEFEDTSNGAVRFIASPLLLLMGVAVMLLLR